MTCTFQWYRHHRRVFISTIQLLMVQYWDVRCLFACSFFLQKFVEFQQNWDWAICCFCLAVMTCTVGKLQYHVHVFGWFMLCLADELYRHIAPRLTNSSVCHPSQLNYMYSGVVVPSSAWVEGSAGRWCPRLTLVWLSFKICSACTSLLTLLNTEHWWVWIDSSRHRTNFALQKKNLA